MYAVQKMRVHVVWLLLVILTSGLLLAALIYQSSWIPAYGEAEPLYPTASEFGRVLAQQSEGGVVAADIEALLKEERFSPIRPYGIVFSDDPEILVSIRVNERFSFDIDEDGQPRWNRSF